MKNWLIGLCALIGACATTNDAPAQAPAANAVREAPITIGTSYTLQSAVLGDDRQINVWTPSDYASAENANRRYNVLYVLDGALDQDFQHIAGLGHRRIGILALELDDQHEGPASLAAIEAATYSTSRDRALAYFDVFEKLGVPRGSIPIYETRSTRDSVYRGLEHIFAAGERPTAILAMSDRVAMFALDWLRERNLRVPEDVSIIGFDGVPEAALTEPPLTTVEQPIAEIGRRAVERILSGDASVKRETLPVTLVVRSSTGRPPQS